MALILDGSNGLSDVDGSAATPAIRGTDTNTGIFFPAADTIAFSEGGVESMRINSSGGVQVLNCLAVGNATPSTSGAGITFPATQSASSDANTLDDYEEGTWTPTASSGAGSITSYTATGLYTKIGRIVTLNGRVSITNGGTASGTLFVANFPFQSITFDNSVFRTGVGIVRENGITGIYYGMYGTANTVSGAIEQITTAINYGAGYVYIFTLVYESAA
jgi:hypothetical protein